MSKILRHFWKPIKRKFDKEKSFVVTDECMRCKLTRDRIKKDNNWSVRYHGKNTDVNFAPMCQGNPTITIPLNKSNLIPA